MIGLLFVAQLAVVAHGPDTASVCAPIDVTVASRVAGNVPARIEPAVAAPSLQFLKSTISTRIERDGAGRPSALTEGTFTYAASAAGPVALPTFIASAAGVRATAVAEPVHVHDASALPPIVIVRAWLDRGNGRGPVDSLYVGQQMDYVVDVHLNEPARQRLRRNPTFFPPEMPGVLAYDLAAPSAVSRAGRACFQTLSYRRALFPLFAGRSAIAPAALTYSLPLSTSFFSREESFELRTDSVRFTALDVPVEGRPADFGGAVGVLSVASRLSATQARMGDPVVFTVRVEGTGNVKLWPRPALSIPWGAVANGAERVVVDTTQSRVRGAKEFDWLLTPRVAGTKDVPRIDYRFFDAELQRYGVATAPPLRLDVATAALATLDSAPSARLGIRRTLREEVADPIASQPWFWMLFAMAPLPAVFRRTREPGKSRADGRTSLQRLKAAVTKGERLSPRTVRRLFVETVAERVPSSVGCTRSADFTRALRRSGVAPDVAEAAAALLEHLDAAAFSSASVMDANALRRAAQVAGDIDVQAIRPAPRSTPAVVILLLTAGVSLGALALPSGVVETFSEGVQAYDHVAYTTSQRLFSRVATRAPRAADAWVNLGTAAWARGDSAVAVRAWQRALRLDPLDSDARDRLEKVQAPPLRTPGFVPPIPVDLPAGSALALWIGACALLALPPSRRPVRARTYAGAAITLSAVLILGTFELRDRLAPRDLGVLRDTRLLRDAPGSTTATASGVVGETGIMGAREGGWIYMALDRTRAGWVPVASVLPMDAPPASD